jgi:hypothetical protein
MQFDDNLGPDASSITDRHRKRYTVQGKRRL